MIIIKIQGGLGNQLFQYAFGRLLELRYNKIVAYDISFYKIPNIYTPRLFYLDKFRTIMRIATDNEIQMVKYPYGLLSKVVVLFKKAINKYFIQKYQIIYDENFLKSLEKKDAIYLEGFWQSYKYCLPIMDKLNQESILRDDLCKEAEEIKQKIISSNSVSVHIRRGDYLNSGKDLQALKEEYYENAVKYIKTKINNPRYFIFSDDINWVKETISGLFQDVTYVTGDTIKDYEELVLISTCKYNVIANSTFSWWGALINKNENKIVISPKDWKNANFLEDDNLRPKEWIRV